MYGETEGTETSIQVPSTLVDRHGTEEHKVPLMGVDGHGSGRVKEKGFSNSTPKLLTIPRIRRWIYSGSVIKETMS